MEHSLIMKRLFLMSFTLLAVCCSTICFGENDLAVEQDSFVDEQDDLTTGSDTLTIFNDSGSEVFIYDWDMSLSPAVTISPVKDGNPLKNRASIDVPMHKVANTKANVGRRIFVANKNLIQSLERDIKTGLPPAMPDAFCPWYDGDKMYSFVEYFYEPDSKRYNINLSYIDEFSYPITIKFDKDVEGTCQKDFEYGFRGFKEACTALSTQTDYLWGNLVWPKDDPSCQMDTPQKKIWPKGIYRMMGPNKVWTGNQQWGLSKYAPNTYHKFIKILPWNGTQLFSTVKAPAPFDGTNFNGWKYLANDEPSSTGYPKALRSISESDNSAKQKFGFFTYCQGNKSDEFTYVPLDTHCTFTIHPYDK